MAQAAFEYSATLNNRLFVSRKTEEEARLSWQALRTACERVLLLRNAAGISRDVLVSRFRLREAGQESDLRVLDAQTEVFNAEINLVSAIFDGWLSVYRMLLAVGRLDFESLNREDAHVAPTNPLVQCDETTLNPFELKLDPNLVVPTALSGAPPANPFAPAQEDEEGAPSANPFAPDDDEEENETAPSASAPAAPAPSQPVASVPRLPAPSQPVAPVPAASQASQPVVAAPAAVPAAESPTLRRTAEIRRNPLGEGSGGVWVWYGKSKSLI